MKKLILFGAALTCGISSQAQVAQGYQEFRQKILDDYQDFRRTILSHYADFLEGKWHEYEALEPMKREDTPKPIKVPDVKVSKPSVKPVIMPDAKPHMIPMPERKPIVAAPEEDIDEKPGSLLDLPKTVIPPEAGNEIPVTLKVRPELGTPMLAELPPRPAPLPLPEPEQAEEPIPEEEPIPAAPESRVGKDVVDFYGMEILVPKIDFKISRNLDKVSDLARHWKLLDEQDLAEAVEVALLPKIKELGLNDYLTYEFLCAYMDSKFPEAGLSPRVSAVHYILANMGYGARIAVATQTGDPLILMPTEQKLYGKVYMVIGGDNYYVMSPSKANLQGASIATCDLPKVANAARKFDLRINGLNLPRKERSFDVSHGNLNLKGTLNENLMPIVYRYPQMDTQDFAVSVLDKEMRADLVRQVKEQLGDKDKLKATNELLQFTQSGFDYATDDAFHGFEKPYFLEENFYYPKNDCEDRAIFYTYMLWNALGVENQLLAFPGHESASVSIPGANIKGTSYESDGKIYFISDPTYVGSSTGQCMRQYETTSPGIDHSYPD